MGSKKKKANSDVEASKESSFDNSLKELKVKCAIEALKLDEDEYSILNLSKNDSEGKLSQNDSLKTLQNFLDEVLCGGLFDEISETAKRIDNEIEVVDVGLISVLDVTKYWTDNEGYITYHFCTGGEKLWTERLEVLKDNGILSGKAEENYDYEKIKEELSDGLRIGNRDFGANNGTGLLLSKSRSEKIFKIEEENQEDKYLSKVLIAGDFSNSGNRENVKKLKNGCERKWFLYYKGKEESEEKKKRIDDRPQVFAMISKNDQPLGFWQLKIKLPETDEYLYEETNVYSGNEEGIHVYKPELPWAKQLNRLVSVVCSYFLAPVLARAHQVIRHYKNINTRQETFSNSFLQAMSLTDNDKANTTEKLYEKSPWLKNILEIKECLVHGYFDPKDLAIGMISQFWEEQDGIKELKLNERAEAENTLYWLQNYREHFIHSLKVFLIGERIIAEILKNKKKNAVIVGKIQEKFNYTNFEEEFPLKDFEECWMLASTVHDWGYPIEKITEITQEYWEKFLVGKLWEQELVKGGDSSKKNDQRKSALEFNSKQIFADCALGENVLSSFLYMLNYDMNDNKESFGERWFRHQNGSRNTYSHEIVKHLICNSDHGVASALWFLNKVLRRCKLPEADCDSPCLKPTTDSIGTGRYNLCSYHSLAEKDKNNVEKYFTIAHSIFYHNLLGEKELTLDVNFNDRPLTFLLFLCDFFQDEGRPISDKYDKKEIRPVGFITKISSNDTNVIYIDIEYRWDLSKDKDFDMDYVLLGGDECKKHVILRKQMKKEDAKCLGKDNVVACLKGLCLCPHAKIFNELLGPKILKALNGLSVTIKPYWNCKPLPIEIKIVDEENI